MLLRSCRLAFVPLFIAGCTEKPPASHETPAARDSANTSTATGGQRTNAWDSTFGAFVGYGSDSGIVALLPSFADGLPDSDYDARQVNGSRVDLFGERGYVASARISGVSKASEEEGCFMLPNGRLDPVPPKWSVALPAGRATGIPVAGLGSLSGSDSVALASRIKDLAATVSHAQDSVWRELPFGIDYAGRFEVEGSAVVFAATTRILPGEQHYSQTIFFIGERPATASDSVPFRLAYSHRSFGESEETTSGLPREDEVGVAAAVLMKAGSRPTLLLETRGNEVNGFAAVRRIAPGKWAVTWVGPHEGGC